jgi:hypothetical protein
MFKKYAYNSTNIEFGILWIFKGKSKSTKCPREVPRSGFTKSIWKEYIVSLSL